MTLPTAHWYLSHVIDILIVCSLVLSIDSHEGLAQNLSLTLKDLQDSSKNEMIENRMQKQNPSRSSPLIPFTDTFLGSLNNFTSQEKIVPSTELLLLYPDLRNVILKEYMRTQRRYVYPVTTMNESLNYNFIPSTYLENELRQNIHRYGVLYNPFRPTLIQMSVSISFEPLRLLSWLLKMIR